MKIVFVVGPTASGKSALSLQLAQQHCAEIVNADSVQVYQRVDIGSAKPTLEERQKVPHHLFDVVSPGSSYTAGDYRRDALEVIESCKKRNVPRLVFVGGSGFYIQALIHGMYESPKLSLEETTRVQEEIQAMGFEKAFATLQEQDVEYAATLSPNDHYRIQRAFEIMKATGRLVSEIKRQQKENAETLNEDYKVFGIQVEREVLRQRVAERTQEMLRRGWTEEVRALIEEGYADWEPLNSVGYAQIKSFLRGEIDRSEMVEQIVMATMQLAKRQSTWFRNRVRPVWLDLKGNREDSIAVVDQFLSSEPSA